MHSRQRRPASHGPFMGRRCGPATRGPRSEQCTAFAVRAEEQGRERTGPTSTVRTIDDKTGASQAPTKQFSYAP